MNVLISNYSYVQIGIGLIALQFFFVSVAGITSFIEV